MKNLEGKVVLTHPGKHQHFYQLAFAAQEAGLLSRFMTALYYLPDQAPCRQLERLPKFLSGRFLARIKARRLMPGLAPERVTSMPYFELMASACDRIPLFRDLIGRINLLLWKNRLFDDWVGRNLRVKEGMIVHSLLGCARRTFRAAREGGATTILDVAGNPLTDQYIAPEYGKKIGRHILSERVKAEIALADFVFSPSDFVSEGMISAGFPVDRIVKIPYGADTERFQPSPFREEGPIRILFVGNVGLRKGVRYLLEAYAGLNLPDVKLTIIGRPVDRQSESVLRRYDGTFEWIPHASYDELHRWYQDSDLFVFPSLAEGSALVTYEAMACGLPMIVTANCGSVVRDGVDGFVIPIRDVPAIREKIRILATDKELRRRMSLAARERAGSFTWRRYREMAAAAYARIAESGPRR